MTGMAWWLPLALWFVGVLGIFLAFMKAWIAIVVDRGANDRD